MDGFDDDVITIGSGFGGSVAAMRAVEKRYMVAVPEAGRRWRDEDLHAAGSLSAGLLDDTTIMSPCDGTRVDITSGAAIDGPSDRRLDTSAVRATDGQLAIAV